MGFLQVLLSPPKTSMLSIRTTPKRQIFPKDFNKCNLTKYTCSVFESGVKWWCLCLFYSEQIKTFWKEHTEFDSLRTCHIVSSSEHRWLNAAVLLVAFCQSTQRAGRVLLPICLVYHCQWTSPSVHLVSFFCRFSLPDLPLFYQGRSETHGVLWQLFKQPRSLSKGRCLHWSESCLFSSGRCFPLQAWAGTKMALYQKHKLGKREEWQNTPWPDADGVVCVCVCASVSYCGGKAEWELG